MCVAERGVAPHEAGVVPEGHARSATAERLGLTFGTHLATRGVVPQKALESCPKATREARRSSAWVSRSARTSQREVWCRRWESNPHDLAATGF